MRNEPEFLGIGWSFPPSFNRESKGVDLVKGIEDINQSLQILLSTSLGERVMQPKYGCNLSDYQFEPLNNGLIGYLRDLVETAILLFEPRIRVENVFVTPAESLDIFEGRFIIEVFYEVESTNSRYNFVYDFYLIEAEPS